MKTSRKAIWGLCCLAGIYLGMYLTRLSFTDRYLFEDFPVGLLLLGVVIVVLSFTAFGVGVSITGRPETKAIMAASVGKTEEQKEVIKYFLAPPNSWLNSWWFGKKISDDEYRRMVEARRDSLNLRKKALDKLGLDEDEINEIAPVMFEGFLFDDAYAKKNLRGRWVSSAYQVSWIFFTSTQIAYFSHTFYMDKDEKSESTNEFYYKDITSFSTSSRTEKAYGTGNNPINIEANKFCIVVPGDKLYISLDGDSDYDAAVHAMKQKLKEKKM